MLRRFLNCLDKGRNKEAKAIFPELENPRQWIDTTGFTFLHYSAFHGNAEMTQYLIDKGFNVNAQNRNGVTPLSLAVEASHVNTVGILLKNNADIYAADRARKSSTLLKASFSRLASSRSAEFKQDVQIVLEMLFDRVNKDFAEGKLTQFLKIARDLEKFVVVIFGNAELTRFLLENGYSINFREPGDGLTALHIAMWLADVETTKILIEHGANVSALDNGGNSPLNFYPENFCDVDENSEILKIFLRDSTHLPVPNQDGMTELEYLLTRGKKKTVKTVLQSGIHLEKCFITGRSLISLLVINDDLGVLDLLLELDIKFDVNQRSTSGFPALMIAAHIGCLHRMEFLLRHGADVNLTLPTGVSILRLGLADNPKGYPKEDCDVVKILELLLRHGADARAFFRHEIAAVDFYPNFGIKVIVAHLAILETLEQISSKSLPRSQIELKRYKAHFDSCVKQLEKMKQFEVYGTVTLFKLLTEKEEKIVDYARNEELTSALNRALKKFSHLESYYITALRGRVSRASDTVKLQAEVALVIEALTGLCSSKYYAIVYEIIGFLDHQDLCNLCQMKDVLQ